MKKNYNLLSWRKAKSLMAGLLTVAFASLSYGQIATNNFDTDLGWTVNHTSGSDSNAGWTRVTSGTNPTIANPPAGNGMARFNAYSIDAGNVYELNSPAMTFAGSSYRVTFKMYRDSDYINNTDKIEVFYNTVEGSTGGVSLGTVNRSTSLAPAVSTTGWNNYTFNIPGNPSGNGYISFVATSAYGNNIYVDEIVVEEIPSCINPTSVTSAGITTTSADISWTAPATAPANGYEYYYSTDANEPTESITASGTSTATTTNITGLTPGTVYYAWVRSVCSTSDKSAWSNATSFTTECTEYTASYTQNFDAETAPTLNTCWATKLDGVASSYAYVKTYESTTLSVSASNSVAFYNSDDTSGTYYLISPNFSDLDNNKQVVMQFFKNFGSDTEGDMIELGVVTDPSDMTTYTMVQAISIADLAEDAWKEVKVNMTSYSGGAGHIVIKYKPGTGTYNYLYVDNFVYQEIPSCIEPTSVTLADVTTTSADISWTVPATAPANGYEYYYSTDATEPTESATASGASTVTTTNITGLTPGTVYYVWVRSVCSTSDKSVWSDVTSFATECEAYTASYTQNFDAETAPALNTCWATKLDGVTSSYASVKAYQYTNLSNSVRFYNSGDTSGTYYLISPNFSDLDNNKQVIIQFYKNFGSDTEGDTIELGVATDPSDMTTYTMVQAISIADLVEDAWKEVKVNMTSYSGGAGHIVVKYKPGTGTYNYLYVDDFVYQEIPSCDTPMDVNSVNANPIASSIDISWTAPAVAPVNGYEYYYSTDNTAPDASTVASGTSTTTTTTITGLALETQYYIWVRSVCSASDKSDWLTTPHNFKLGYCDSVPTSNDGNGISNTVVNGTALAGTDVTYQDHKATVSDAAQGSEVTVDITFATGYTYDTHIWVDLNDNFEFEASELVYSGESTATNPTTLNATFTLATDAALGQHRMRIGSADSGQSTPNPCYSGTYGVTIDTVINVTEVLATQEIDIKDMKGVQLYPNPFQDVVYINDIKGVEKVTIVDMAGRVVKTFAPSKELNLTGLNSGMYLVNLSYEDGSIKTLKAIKK